MVKSKDLILCVELVAIVLFLLVSRLLNVSCYVVFLCGYLFVEGLSAFTELDSLDLLKPPVLMGACRKGLPDFGLMSVF